MKILKSHKDFLKESFKNEYDRIKEVILKFNSVVILGPSFMLGYYNHDGESDLKQLKSHLMKNGYDLDYFMQKYKKEIYNDVDFTECCGFFDYLLYTYDSSFPLSGVDILSEPEDKLIKYTYGYQTKKLGREYILQNYNSLGDFYKDCAENFNNYLHDNFDYSIDKKDIKLLLEDNYSLFIVNYKKNKHKIDSINLSIGNSIKYVIKNNLAIFIFGDLNNKKIDEIIEKLFNDENVKKWLDEIEFRNSVSDFNL